MATDTHITYTYPPVMTPSSVYGKNTDFPTFIDAPLPKDISVRVYSAVVWNGAEFVGLTIVRGHYKSQDAALVNFPATAGDAHIQKLVNPSGLRADMVAVFFHLWSLPVIEWEQLDIPLLATTGDD